MPETTTDPCAGLPLASATTSGWAAAALGDLPALLADHAHCEQKAAAQALALVARHPEAPGLVRAMLALAQEEIVHFRQALDALEARGGRLGRPTTDAYAAGLRDVAARTPGGCGPLVDTLLACALIEARSCERFRCLVARLERPGAPPEEAALAPLYRKLGEAEARHWEVFRDLAAAVAPRPAVDARLATLAAAEAALVATLPHGPRVH